MRLTIKNHNQVYLQSLAQELGCDISEALNYLLLTLRHENYYFQKSSRPSPVTQPTPVQPQDYFPIPTAFTNDFKHAFTDEYNRELAQKTDPIIERMASLIEAF
jgi:hypothetical protein